MPGTGILVAPFCRPPLARDSDSKGVAWAHTHLDRRADSAQCGTSSLSNAIASARSASISAMISARRAGFRRSAT
jgi:hypothetical protein